VALNTIEIQDEEFGTLIVQLRALGLIEKSERNRSVKDKATYWKLTAYGDQHLTTLRAIRKDGNTVDDGDPTDARDTDDGAVDSESSASAGTKKAKSKARKAAKVKMTRSGSGKAKAG